MTTTKQTHKGALVERCGADRGAAMGHPVGTMECPLCGIATPHGHAFGQWETIPQSGWRCRCPEPDGTDDDARANWRPRRALSCKNCDTWRPQSPVEVESTHLLDGNGNAVLRWRWRPVGGTWSRWYSDETGVKQAITRWRKRTNIP